MKEKKKLKLDAKEFRSIKIGLASPERIKEWAKQNRHWGEKPEEWAAEHSAWFNGEVKSADTFYYKSLDPVPGGLFCERVFGPTKTYECSCGRYKGAEFNGRVCEKCGVEIRKVSRKKSNKYNYSRRDRMGYFTLQAPVANILFFGSNPCAMNDLLGMKRADLENVLYCLRYIVLDPGDAGKTHLRRLQLLNKQQLLRKRDEFGDEGFRVGIGAEAIKELLSGLDLGSLEQKLRTAIAKEIRPQRKRSLQRRLQTCLSFAGNGQKTDGNRPEWMIMDVLPIISPDVRPIVEIENGSLAGSDLNDLYRLVISRSGRLRRMEEKTAPDLMLRWGKYMLQEAVDCLLDGPRSKRSSVSWPDGRKHKSLLDMLGGKYGWFRHNLLGKRVDFSGRSVIVVEPELKMQECGLPKEMALELFKPFVIRKLIQEQIVWTIPEGKRLVHTTLIYANSTGEDYGQVWESLDRVLLQQQEQPDNKALECLKLAVSLRLISKKITTKERTANQMIKRTLAAAPEDRYRHKKVWETVEEIIKEYCTEEKEKKVEFFRSLVVQEMREQKPGLTEDTANKMIDRALDFENYSKVWQILEKEVKDKVVLLNRAPTLHRLGVQAFWPKLCEGKAIKLHPLVCAGFNADFDGDQMAVHLPLSEEAQEEARRLMLSINNMLAPKDGKALTVPSQDMVLGSYYLTVFKEGAKGEGKCFSSKEEALLAYENNVVDLQARIRVRIPNAEIYEAHCTEGMSLVTTSVGNIIFNQELPVIVRSFDRTLEGWELGRLMDKKELGKLVARIQTTLLNAIAAETLDKIKKLGYHYACLAGISLAVPDIRIPAGKKEILAQTEADIERMGKQFRRGLLSAEEYYRKTVELWGKATDKITEELQAGTLDKLNPLYIMANSGARGDWKQIRQLAGMRGLMSDANGRTIAQPVKANFREGLNVLEYFISTHGARKGLVDKALRTAETGYLTRRLVDVAHSVVVTENDCCPGREGQRVEGIVMRALGDGALEVSLKERIAGRYLAEDIRDGEGNVIYSVNTYISKERAEKIETELGRKEVRVRSALTCRTEHGICRKCYGQNLATGKIVEPGEPVGVVAAQAISEPATQLTMRNFHTGGVAGGNDITQGMPLVEALFEVKKLNRTQQKEEKSAYPKGLLFSDGGESAMNYIVDEIVRAYKQQGVEINEKHIEVIVRQMFRQYCVEDAGDTDLIPGTLVEPETFAQINAAVLTKGGRPAVARPLGITRAALAAESFLSAASFQDTKKVLAEAAIKGREDPLRGMKENVLFGRRIPAGATLKRH